MVATVHRDIVVGLLTELIQFSAVLARYPPGAVNAHGLIDTVDLVFVREAEGDHLELQYTHGAHDQIVVLGGHEDLHRALFGQLLQALLQLLSLQRVLQAYASK